MKKYQCDNCKLRNRYDEKPNSLIGKFWRWHINFCPGWKGYMNSVDAATKAKLTEKYNFKK